MVCSTREDDQLLAALYRQVSRPRVPRTASCVQLCSRAEPSCQPRASHIGLYIVWVIQIVYICFTEPLSAEGQTKLVVAPVCTSYPMCIAF